MNKDQFHSKLTNRHQKWLSVFNEWENLNIDINYDSLSADFDFFLKYRNLLKQDVTIDFALLLIKGNKDQIIEKFHDKIHNTVHNKQKINFIKSLKTKKYKKLISKKVEDELSIILDNNISIDTLKSQFINKIAKYKNSRQLLKSLTQFKLNNINWNKDYYLDHIKNKNLNVIITKETKFSLMIKIFDYNACKELGSQAWCIVNSYTFYEQYISKYKDQYIYMDFSLPIEDVKSLIGIHKIDDIIKVSHLKNDQITSNEYLNTIDTRHHIIKDTEIDAAFNSKFPSFKINFLCTYNAYKHYDYITRKNETTTQVAPKTKSENLFKNIISYIQRYLIEQKNKYIEKFTNIEIDYYFLRSSLLNRSFDVGLKIVTDHRFKIDHSMSDYAYIYRYQNAEKKQTLNQTEYLLYLMALYGSYEILKIFLIKIQNEKFNIDIIHMITEKCLSLNHTKTLSVFLNDGRFNLFLNNTKKENTKILIKYAQNNRMDVIKILLDNNYISIDIHSIKEIRANINMFDNIQAYEYFSNLDESSFKNIIKRIKNRLKSKVYSNKKS